MPLLGKKVFTLASNSPNGAIEDAPYLIPHTKERFQSKSEYKKRKDLYAQNIWTCRATGHINLTHEEACKSEKMVANQLASNFPKCYEKDILELVHHSTDSLESLVDKGWLKLHQQFVIGEKVNLKVKVADKLIPAKVVEIDSSCLDVKSASSTCNSPSSDKENSADEKDKDKSSKKWVPPKLLPYTYSIELETEAQVIHSIPGTDLHRIERVPSKDMVRHFIRVSALRSGTTSTSPWVVNADLVRQYNLVSKFADYLFSPLKMSEAFQKARENSKKRKLSNGTLGSAAKKLKLHKTSEAAKNIKPGQGDKVMHKASTPKNNKKFSHNSTSSHKKLLSKKLVSPTKKKSDRSSMEVSDSDPEDKTTLAKLKRSSSIVTTDSDSDVPLHQLVDLTSSKKKKKSKNSNVVDSSDEDIPLSKITPPTPKGSTPKADINGSVSKVNSLSKSEKKNEKSMKKKSKNVMNEHKKKEGKKQLTKKENMRKVTLDEITKGGKLETKSPSNTTPKKKPAASAAKPPCKPPPMPAIVQRLLSCKRDTIYDKMKYSNLLKKAISILSPKQIKNLPEKLREEFEHKKRFIEEKDKMAKMTPEERETYLKEKREQAKKLQKQKLNQKLKDKRRRFEDTNLQLTPLPQAKLVPTPDAFPNTLFGDVVMVTEFINCYGGLLMPESEYPIYTDALIKALVGGSYGFAYISRVLMVLLQTLLQDHIAKGYSELGTHVSDIAVSAYTSSELARLCLSCEDSEDGVRDVPENYVKLLKNSEFYQLGVQQKLCLLRGLCSRVLATYSVQDYMEEQQRKANILTRQKNTEMKQIAAQKKSQKQNPLGVKPGFSKAWDTSPAGDTDTGNQSGDGSFSSSPVDGRDVEDFEEDSTNWGSIVKRRRLLTAKAAAEKRKQEKERMAMRQKEYQAEKQREKLRKQQEQISEAINLARMVLRQEPIGTDRNHDRYWVFTNVTPGLYVERGWMGEEVNYHVQNQSRYEADDLSSESEEDDVLDDRTDHTDKTPLKYVYRARRHVIETSFPSPGQNMWFTYRSQKDLDGLLKSLHPQGIRESLLRAEIKKRCDDISRAIVQAQRTNLELRDSDGDTEMVAAFKKELSEMELRLRNGGLGGVPNYEKWEVRLMEATDISVLADCLLQVKEGILEKFLQGFMKPAIKSNDVQEEEKGLENVTENKKLDGADTKEKPHEKEDKTEKAVREWREAVGACQTMSRLHVLMAILDSCVKWEKSAENAKCKICRKKCNDTKLLLCDECNQAFHMYCLRPSLTTLPVGDWFCPACKPRKLEVRSIETESEADENEDKGAACRECGGAEKLIVCSKCLTAFHTQCHDPPLRHPPRGTWQCSDCKNGVNRRRRGTFSRKAALKRSYRNETSASEEDDEESEYEEEEEAHTSSSSRSHKHQESARRRERKQENCANQSGRMPRSRNSSHRNSHMLVTSPARTSKRGPSELSLCEDILQKVMKHKSSWPFLEPVDKKMVPDYHSLIKKPMDFQTMQKKCARLSYASPQEFIEDAALVFENAAAYNKCDSEIYQCMLEAEIVFKDALHKLLPDWPYYRTVVDKEENSSGSETGNRRSQNK